MKLLLDTPTFIEEEQPNMDIAEIRRRVRAGAYLVKRDAILHAVKE